MTDFAGHPLDYLAELALGVLPGEDAGYVRAHLETCDTCAAEFRDMLEVARVLPLAGADVQIAPSLRASVMDRIGREPRPPVRPWTASRWRLAAIAAGVALLVAAGIGGGFAIGRSTGPEGQVAGSGSPESALISALVNGSAQESEVKNGDLQITFLRARGATTGFVSGKNLPPLPQGKAYEAWFSPDGTHMEPATVFTSAGGTWIEAPGPIADYVALGFSIEDRGGAKAPTTAPFALLDLRAASPAG